MAASIRAPHPTPPQAPSTSPPSPPPPPPPPLPSSSAPFNPSGVLQRLVAGLTPRPPTLRGHQSAEPRIGPESLHTYSTLPAQTVAHKTGIPIAAVDISPDKTHAVLAGKEILKTVRVADRKITEDLNFRSAVTQYASTHARSHGESVASERRDFLSASDVKWSHGKYDSIIATAANNGRLSIYDVKRPEVELLWLHQHTRQVHRLGFNPFEGALLLSGSHDGTVKYWDLRNASRSGAVLTLRSNKHFLARAEAVRDLRWSPTDGVEFITSTDSGTIFKWDSRKTDRPELRVNAHGKACYAVDWHPDGRHVISGGADKNVLLWDFKNPNRRQKPCSQFRVPQTVMNLRWRPASWSSTARHTSQIAVAYNQDDPRLHIWDLRRPWIPVRELDRYKSPATSLLWCTDDLLWTVGKEGMFTQTNVQRLPQPPEEISPCTMAWLATGEHAVFAEDRRRRGASGNPEDLSITLLGSNREDLGGEEQAATSRSMTDDEGIHERLLGASYKAVRAKRASTKSAKSLGNTPPSRDDQTPILSLDETLLVKTGLSANRQVGVFGKITAATTDAETAQFLAENYVPPSTEAQRRANPAQILMRLEEVFKVNGDVCQQVSRHRLAQSWRVLGAVILSELRAWADRHRRERLKQDVLPVAGPDAAVEPAGRANVVSPSEIKQKSQPVDRLSGPHQTRKPDLFKQTLRNDAKAAAAAGEDEGASTTTTPLARPSAVSTFSTPSRSPRPLLNIDEPVGPILQLPPAAMASRSAAAAAASQALRVEVDRSIDAQASSVGGSSTEAADDAQDLLLDVSEPHPKQYALTPEVVKRSKSGWGLSRDSRACDEPQRLHSRRAALREYKAQARPVLNFDTSFEESTRSSLPIPLNRHNSSDSLQMFSESGSSSHKAKSPASSGSVEASYHSKSSMYSDDWAPENRPSLERSSSSQEDMVILHQRRLGVEHDLRSGSRASNRSTSPFPEVPFEFEGPGHRHARTPLRSVSRSPLAQTQSKGAGRVDSPPPTADELQSSDYIYADFQPIDISSYHPNSHAKPWAAVPLIAQAVAFDLGLGDNHAQFSSHLLMHVHPFFFHRKFRRKETTQPVRAASTVAERLLQPHLSYRVIESIFSQYHTFLKSLSLHVQAAELRKLCVELDLPFVYRPHLDPDGDGAETTTSSFNDGFVLAVTCTNAICQAPLNLLSNDSDSYAEPMSCTRCHTARPPCPLCLSIKSPTGSPWPQHPQHPQQRTAWSSGATTGTGLWSFCPSCGHSAHTPCMAAWLRRPGSRGECPSPGCGHDCAPGEVRRRRMAELAISASASAVSATASPALKTTTAPGREDGGAAKGSVPLESSSTDGRRAAAVDKSGVAGSINGDNPTGTTTTAAAPSLPRDPWRSRPSPAVDRTRGLLLRNTIPSTTSPTTTTAGPLSPTASASASAPNVVGVIPKAIVASDPERNGDQQGSSGLGTGENGDVVAAKGNNVDNVAVLDDDDDDDDDEGEN